MNKTRFIYESIKKMITSVQEIKLMLDNCKQLNAKEDHVYQLEF